MDKKVTWVILYFVLSNGKGEQSRCVRHCDLLEHGRIEYRRSNRKILWILNLEMVFIDFNCFRVTARSNISSIR